MASIRQEVGIDTCRKCRRKLERGARVMVVHIVENVLRDPKGFGMLAMLSGEFELAHVSCADPYLDKGLVLVE
jgi:hypothetical protein